MTAAKLELAMRVRLAKTQITIGVRGRRWHYAFFTDRCDAKGGSVRNRSIQALF